VKSIKTYFKLGINLPV